MRSLWLCAVVALVGCRYSEEHFVSDYTQAECTYALACFDQAVLTFNGWDAVETCVADLGPRNGASNGQCVYEAKAAKECVKQLEARACAGGGAHELPAICRDVQTFCETVDDTGGDTDTGADTDTDTDPGN